MDGMVEIEGDREGLVEIEGSSVAIGDELGGCSSGEVGAGLIVTAEGSKVDSGVFSGSFVDSGVGSSSSSS